MSLKNNPLSENTDNVKDMWADDDCVGSQDNQTAIGTVTKLKYHDIHPIVKGITDTGKFLFESIWCAVKSLGQIAFAMVILCVLIVVFIGAPVIAISAFTEGQYIAGSVCAFVSLVAWGAAINSENNC